MVGIPGLCFTPGAIKAAPAIVGLLVVVAGHHTSRYAGGQATVGTKITAHMSIQNSIAVAIFLILVAITVGAAIAVRSHFNTESRVAFEDVVEGVLVALKEDISENLAELTAIQGLFNSTGDVSRNQFDTFVSLFFNAEHGTQALEWIPRVPREGREEFIQKVREEGFDQFTIHPTTALEESFPVNYVFPFEPNLAAFGFDLASNESRLAALQQARDSGALLATEPITLVQETEQQAGFLVFAPIYSTGDVPADLQQRRQTLSGFGLAVFRVGDFIGDAIPESRHSGFNLRVTDSVPGMADTVIHTDNQSFPNLSGGQGIEVIRTVDVAGRQWVFEFAGPSGFGISGLSRLMWIIVLIAGGILSTLTLGFSYLLLNGRNRAVAFAENMNRSLIQSESQRDQMFELSQDLIITAGQDGRFGFVSGAARSILGRDPSAMMGAPFLDFIHPDDRDNVAQAAESIFKEGTVNSFEARFLREDGSAAWMEWNALLLPEPSQLIFAVGRDITERREIDRMKDEFISVASHELRTPVTSIKGFVELLVEEQTGPLNKEQTRFLEAVNRNTVRLEKLVNDLLDISRLDTGTISLDRTAFELMEVVQQVMAEMSSEIDAKSLKIHTTAMAPEIVIDADRSRTIQILANLLSNAVKYSPPGSSVDIEITSLPDRNFVQVNIRDHGPGVADEDKLFQKFFRADNSTTRSTAGTGLGLAIAKALVELQGGELWVKSQCGQGSTFCFSVPRGSVPI